jgi:hypothetical protein
MNRRTLATMGIGSLLLVAVLAVDLLAPPPEAPGTVDVEPVSVTPVAGSSTCAVGDGRDGTTLTVTAARPGQVADGPAELDVRSLGDGSEELRTPPPVFPGVHTRVEVEGGEDHATGVSWRRGPVAVEREWRVGPPEEESPDEAAEDEAAADEAAEAEAAEDEAAADEAAEDEAAAEATDEEATDEEAADEEAADEEAEEPAEAGGIVSEVGEEFPPGTIAGPCPSAVAGRWVVPGMTTVGGSDARLRIANPYATDATLAIGFVTPEGPEEPLALQNLSVPAGGTMELAVNEFMPERADLSAVVRVLSGRAAVEGYQLTRAAIGDIDGASLLAASTGPSESWTVPWVEDSEAYDSWLWVVNLGDRPAPVELTLHTEEGGVPPEGLSEVTVAPGQLRRIDLRGTLPEGVSSAAVTARSEGAPIHVSAAVQRRDEDPAVSGFVVQLGVPDADADWVVTGGAIGEGRTELLEVVNPGSEPAELSVRLFNGAAVVEPEGFGELTLGPGARMRLDLREPLAGAGSWSAFVTSSAGEVVVGRIGLGGQPDGLHLLATPGTPASAWGAAGEALPSRPVPGSVQRIGTDLGVRSDDPFGNDAAGTPPAAPLDETDDATSDPDPDAEPEPDDEAVGDDGDEG